MRNGHRLLGLGCVSFQGAMRSESSQPFGVGEPWMSRRILLPDFWMQFIKNKRRWTLLREPWDDFLEAESEVAAKLPRGHGLFRWNVPECRGHCCVLTASYEQKGSRALPAHWSDWDFKVRASDNALLWVLSLACSMWTQPDTEKMRVLEAHGCWGLATGNISSGCTLIPLATCPTNVQNIYRKKLCEVMRGSELGCCLLPSYHWNSRFICWNGYFFRTWQMLENWWKLYSIIST